MLKSHHNLLEPRPSDRLRIGDRLVDLPLREIVPADGSAEPVRVTLKSIGVLLTLVVHAGKLVSREALLEWVWPDTLPTDDVVTQAVTQLRKALGDDREHPRYIETIARQGYRLIAPVEWIVESEVTPAPAAESPSEALVSTVPLREPAAATPRTTARSRWWMPVSAAALVATLFVVGHRLDLRPRAATVAALPVPPPSEPILRALEFQRIASLPLTEERPSLSPDGALVVYSRSTEDGRSAPLMLQTSAAMPPRPLTEAVPGQYDSMAAWSPDGREIVFVRSFADHRCLVMIIPAAGGSVREAGECLSGGAHPVGWYPDGKTLVGARRAGYSSMTGIDKTLYRMALDTGRWERIPYAKSSADEDMSPVVSPDGRWIAFQRNISLADLWRIPVGGGKPQRLTNLRTNIYGIAWTSDSRQLVFTRYLDGKLLLSKLDIETGQVVDHHGGDNSFMYPSVSGGGRTVAFEVENARSVMRRVALSDGREAMKKSQMLHDSAGSNHLPTVAPDGRQMVFYSTRTGDLRMWWQDRGEPDTLRSIDAFIPVPRHPAVWRADSQSALAIGRTRAAGYGIYEIEPRRGLAIKLATPDTDPVHVAYHPDPNRLLVVSDHGEGRLGVTLYDRSQRPWRALASVDDVAVAVVDPKHRRIVMASMSTPEIRSADLDLKHVRTIDRVVTQRRNRTLVATADGVRVMDSKACAWQWRLVTVDGGVDDGRCLGNADWWLEGVSFDPSENTIHLSSIEEIQTDIGIAPLSALSVPSPTSAVTATAKR